eukprot:scaffold1059_cov298-Prasinococcus_capsulatus_cf.AAC.3
MEPRRLYTRAPCSSPPPAALRSRSRSRSSPCGVGARPQAPVGVREGATRARAPGAKGRRAALIPARRGRSAGRWCRRPPRWRPGLLAARRAAPRTAPATSPPGCCSPRAPPRCACPPAPPRPSGAPAVGPWDRCHRRRRSERASAAGRARPCPAPAGSAWRAVTRTGPLRAPASPRPPPRRPLQPPRPRAPQRRRPWCFRAASKAPQVAAGRGSRLRGRAGGAASGAPPKQRSWGKPRAQAEADASTTAAAAAARLTPTRNAGDMWAPLPAARPAQVRRAPAPPPDQRTPSRAGRAVGEGGGGRSIAPRQAEMTRRGAKRRCGAARPAQTNPTRHATPRHDTTRHGATRRPHAHAHAQAHCAARATWWVGG